MPYEDDPSQGKDRPVLLLGRDGDQPGRPDADDARTTTVDQEQEAREGRFWMDIGPGPWDSQGRPSEVRLNRFIAIDPETVRREGSVIDEERFEAVAAAVAPYLS